ncbi:MAG: NfeD family protein [Rudaea sp.]
MKRSRRSNRIEEWRRAFIWSAGALFAVLVALRLAMPGQVFAQGPARVDVAHLTGGIDIFDQGYIERVIALAENDGSQALIIEMDTPGGRMDAMQEIIKAILNSRVPVIVYVAPPGADAGSAGTYITYAAHIAAMAPNTRIGAAHPVGGSGQDITGTELTKVMNDSLSLIRSLARLRGRNEQWATSAVSDSISATADEALMLHVVDYIAQDIPDLLNQVNGRKVQVASGEVTLHTSGAPTHDLDMTAIEEFFHVLLDPNIAAILFTVGSLAILVELYNPGAILPAVTGVICIVLSLVALYNLPTNWAALILIVAAIIMFVLDLKVTGFVLTLGGIVSFILGIMFLFRPFTPPEPSAPVVAVSPFVIGGLTLFVAAFFVFILGAAVRSRNVPVITGMTPYLGAFGVATSDIAPEGTVRVRSEDWTAESANGDIHKGDRIQVVAVEGLHLRVVAASPEKPDNKAENGTQA